MEIQIAIFDKLHERLQANLEAYLTMTTSFGRAVGGVTKEEQEKLLGVEGLERLCKTYGSADYLERAMRDWSDDVVSTNSHKLGPGVSMPNMLIVFPRHLGRASPSSSPREENRHCICSRRGRTHVECCRFRRRWCSLRRNGRMVLPSPHPQRENHYRHVEQ